MNGDSLVKRNWPRVLLGLPLFLLRPPAGLLRLVDPSTSEFAKWDRLAADHRIYGYYAADAHFAYGALFSLFHLHVLLDEPPSPNYATARSQILDALRRGRFYNAVEAAAEADGFRFHAAIGGRTVAMGVETRLRAGEAGEMRLVAQAPSAIAHETRILRDGLVVARSEGPDCVHIANRPGVYRAEVSLRERSPLDPRVPWIASNPIFIRKERP
jgi:hypothetical protein